MNSHSRKLRNIIVVALLALSLRTWAAALLPQDFDEPIYIQAAFDYADAIKRGDLSALIDYPGVREHPALVKLMYAGAVVALGKTATYSRVFFASRAISAAFGVVAVILLGLFDPLAGGLLGVHTLAVKYTSQAYLEAVPHALTIACILAFVRTDKGKRDVWFWLSALALGAAAAGKFTYIPVILAVLAYVAFFDKRIPLRWLALYAAVAAATFLTLNVTLWHDPINRLAGALTFHVSYSQGAHVAEVSYPWYQPIIWIFSSAPAKWHPGVFFYGGFDGLISIFALAGLKREWLERRWLAIWFLFGVLFLLIWPTKWPQYAVTLSPALCLMAAESARRAYRWAGEQESYWNYMREVFPQPSKWFWWSIAMFVTVVGLVYFSAAIRVAVGKVGWSHLTTQGSFLPSNTVHDLLSTANGAMIIATDRGAVLRTPPEGADLPDQWEVFTAANSGLPDDRVLALARDSSGNLWFGTEDGVARFDGQEWQSFRPSELGLQIGRVNALATDSAGHVFAGTPNGVTAWDGSSWEPLTELKGEPVFDLFASGDSLWVATPRGVSRYDMTTRALKLFATTAAANAVLVDSSGTTWAATSAGLARLTDAGWQYFTTANSGLPLNTVMAIAEVTPGVLWVGASRSAEAGGLSASFDGTDWKVYGADNSGASGGEPLVIGTDGKQVWIGTRMSGIDILRLER